jgi:hypothetical protein
MAKAVVASATGPAKGRSRSPNFPAISLQDALTKVKAIYDKDGRGPVSSAVLLEHLGYGKNLSGSAGRMISALRQYGLLDDMPDDKYRVSERAFHILTLSEASPIRKAAITTSAQKPPIFRDILAAYPDRLPSDSALRDSLITEKKFNPASVESFIRAFKATVEFAHLAPGAYDPPVDEQGEQGDDVEEAGKQGDVQQRVKPLPIGVVREVSALEEGEAVLQWPASLSAASVDELEAWLQLVIKKVKRRAGVS